MNVGLGYVGIVDSKNEILERGSRKDPSVSI